MTPVDAYDTMLLMGLTDEAADAKRLILERLSFDQDVSVQVFEVTIRLLGGLLSAYEMDGDPALPPARRPTWATACFPPSARPPACRSGT